MNSSIFFNKVFRCAALASAVALGALGASNSFAADATTNSTATVIAPITITKSADLVFGRFAAGVTSGTVTISTSGARSNTGGAILTAANSTSNAAQFDVGGDGSATYSISWSGATALTHTNLTDSMGLARISDLTAAGATSGEVTSGTLTTGAQSIYLGGVLTVGASQVAGTYTGDVTATVEYN